MSSAADKRPSVVERKLVTILSADVAEYSRLMAEDEESTLRTFREHSQTFRALVDMHHGRIFNTAGDALLAEFTSPLEAVRCATDIQAALRTRNDQLPIKRQVRFRIGVNLGDVMMQDSDLLGDGVNVASRLQSAAEPGGICISGSVYDQIRNKLSLNIESLGEKRFKNIPQPVRTFTIAGTQDDGVVLSAPPKASRTPFLRIGSAVVAISRFTIRRDVLAVSAAGVAALLVIAGGYWAYSTLRHQPGHVAAAPLQASAAKPAATTVPSSANVTVVDVSARALLADAQRFNRPQDEIDALTDANTQIATVAAQLRKLGTTPKDRNNVRSLSDQMKKMSVDMGHNEATALTHASAPLWRDLQKPPGKVVGADAAAAIATAKQAKANLDDTLLAAQQAQDGVGALEATRKALGAYDAFAKASEAVAPFYISARRSDLAALATDAHNVSDRVVALGGVKEPWFLASRARKDAYQTLTANAAAAQTQIAELDDVQRRAGSATTLKKVDAALRSATAIKARLDSLLANSNTAYSTFSQ